MSVLERLNNRVPAQKTLESQVFDVKTTQGAFLESVHRRGFQMYKIEYKLKEEHQLDPDVDYPEDALSEYEKTLSLSEEAFNALPDTDKTKYDRKIIFTELHDVLTTPGNQVINAVAGSGKALLNGTGVLTPNGVVPVEKLKPGMQVLGKDGEVCNVLGVYPQDGLHDVWLVGFTNGVVIPCNGEHLWSDSHGVVFKTSDLKVGKRLPPTRGCTYSYEDTRYTTDHTKSGIYIDPLVYAMFLVYDKETIRKLAFTYFDRFVRQYTEITGDDHEIKLVCEMDLCVIADFYASHFNCNVDLPNVIRFGSAETRELFFLGFSERLHEYILPHGLRTQVTEVLSSVGVTVRWTVDGQPVFSKSSNGVDYVVQYVRKTSQKGKMTCIMVDSSDHLFLTEGYALTHNTTALVLKILHDIVTGEAMTIKTLPTGAQVRVVNKMWVCTFLKSGAMELGTALRNWQTKLGYTQTASQVTFSTMDAEFKRCLESMGCKVPIGSQEKLSALLKKAVDTLNIKRDNGNSLSKEDYRIISGIVTYYRGRLDNGKYQHPSAMDYSLTPKMLDLLVNQFATLRKAEGVMDFEEVMELLYKYLYVTPNENIQKYVSERYNYIYIDEFQDTSQMSYAIIKFYARGKLWMNRSGKVVTDDTTGLYTGVETLGKLVAVGDPSQCFVGETSITLQGGEEVEIKDVYDCDFVETALGRGVVGTCKVVENRKSLYTGDLYELVTESGRCLKGTAEHKIPVRENLYPKSGDIVAGFEVGHCSLRSEYMVGIMQDEVTKRGRDTKLSCYIDGECLKALSQIERGDLVIVRNTTGLHYEYVSSVSYRHVENIAVYDLEVMGMHTYFAEGILVHNCIYSFRGSDSKILTEMVDNDFRPTISHLSVNWRCPANILNPIIPSIHLNPDSAKQEIIPANEGGEFTAYEFSSYKAMSTQLQADLQKDMDDGYSVAVLCRTNFNGMIPAFILESVGKFDFGISRDSMTLNSALPRRILEVASLFTERSSSKVKNSLGMFMPYGGGWQLKELMDMLKLNSKSIWDIPVEDLRYSCYGVVPFVEYIRPIIFPDGHTRDRSQDLKALRSTFLYMRANTFGGDSAFCESARAYIDSILYYMDSNKFKMIHDFLSEIEYLNDRLQGRINKTRAPIQIATVHEFKGKERDSVYVWNDSVGVFPSGKIDLDDDAQLEEERRVHYIACTRARKREHIYTLSGKVGKFVTEMDLVLEKPAIQGVVL